MEHGPASVCDCLEPRQERRGSTASKIDIDEEALKNSPFFELAGRGLHEL